MSACRKVAASKGHYPADAVIDTYSNKLITGWCGSKHWRSTGRVPRQNNILWPVTLPQ